MKKIIPLLLLLLSACATKKSILDNHKILVDHKEPLKIFGLGQYASNTLIITLVDADSQYFTIEAPIDTNLKIGKTYPLTH